MFGIAIKPLAIALKGVLLRCICAGVITFQREISLLSHSSRALSGREGMWEFMLTSWRDRKLRHAATCNSPTLVIYFKQCDSASSHLQHSHFPDRARNMRPWGISHYSNHSMTLNNDQEVSIMIISKEMPFFCSPSHALVSQCEVSDTKHNNECWRSIVNTLMIDRLPDCLCWAAR